MSFLVELYKYFDYIAGVAAVFVALSSIIGGTRASFAIGRDKVFLDILIKSVKRFGTLYFSVIGGSIIVILA